MSFFKDFKEDLSQAVDELMPGSDRDLNESYEEPAPSVPAGSGICQAFPICDW